MLSHCDRYMIFDCLVSLDQIFDLMFYLLMHSNFVSFACKSLLISCSFSKAPRRPNQLFLLIGCCCCYLEVLAVVLDFFSLTIHSSQNFGENWRDSNLICLVVLYLPLYQGSFSSFWTLNT